MSASTQEGASFDALWRQITAAQASLARVSIDWIEKQIRRKLPMGGDPPPEFPEWFELCGYSGYRREAVLRDTKDPPKGALFWALAFRRLNDWVPQVRAAARERLPALARRADPVDVAEAVWRILQDWQSWSRLGAPDRQVLVDLFSMEGVARDLERRVLTSTTGAAARVLAQLGRSPIFDARLPDYALHATQPSVRVRALRALFDGRVDWIVGFKWIWTDKQWCRARYVAVVDSRALDTRVDDAVLIDAALRDTSRFVRGAAGEYVMKRLHELGDGARGLAERLAADPHPSVADQGRYALEKLARG